MISKRLFSGYTPKWLGWLLIVATCLFAGLVSSVLFGTFFAGFAVTVVLIIAILLVIGATPSPYPGEYD